MRPLIPCLALLSFACGNGTDATPSAMAAVAPSATPSTAPAHAEPPLPADAEAPPSAPFHDGEKALATVKDALLHHYDGADVTVDELDRAAIQGMLEHIDPRRASWNKLLAPDERRALELDLKGELVGIGIELNFDSATGYTDITGIIPASPAEKVGLHAGDRILDIDGHLFKGKTQNQLLAQIRGKVGETVTLNVLRDDKLITFPIVRQRVELEVVHDGMLPDGIGFLEIMSFNAKTRPGVDASLDTLVKEGAHALIVDLRGNMGGGFDDALATAEALLPAGAGIVKVQKKGEAERVYNVKTGATKLPSVPMVVLTNGETASGAELLTVALRLGRKATVVGEKTFGKWSLQAIEDLSNGYAAKYTISLLRAPTGETYDGVGFTPDIEADLDHKVSMAAWHETDLTKRLAIDTQLRTGVNLLRGR